MKTLLPLALSLASLLALGGDLHSQDPAPKSALETLKAIKAKNQQIIEKQTQTLQKLEDLEKESEQLKAMSKRS